MKINQLFVRTVEEGDLHLLLASFGLSSIQDHRAFTKRDLVVNNTVQKINALLPIMKKYYLPCKASIYLKEPLTEKKALTVLKQVVKTMDYVLHSKEQNINGKKIILYQLMPGIEVKPAPMHIMNKMTDSGNLCQMLESSGVVLSFD